MQHAHTHIPYACDNRAPVRLFRRDDCGGGRARYRAVVAFVVAVPRRRCAILTLRNHRSSFVLMEDLP